MKANDPSAVERAERIVREYREKPGTSLADLIAREIVETRNAAEARGRGADEDARHGFWVALIRTEWFPVVVILGTLSLILTSIPVWIGVAEWLAPGSIVRGPR